MMPVIGEAHPEPLRLDPNGAIRCTGAKCAWHGGRRR